MKKQADDFAILGGPRLYAALLPVGQINIPEWEHFETLASGIFDRRCYSDHGILAQDFENKLCRLLDVPHAVTVTNATIGLCLALKALGLEPGDTVVVPAFTFAATVQALTWAGLEPAFCDVDPHTHNITAQTVAPVLDTPGVKAILGVHLWGNPCDLAGLEALARDREVPLLFDAAHAIGCTYGGRNAAAFGACSVFSFHATKILSATEGGCIATHDDRIAERIRAMRGDYGRHENVPIPVTASARFSEMQAAFGLLSLEDFPKNCADNERRMRLYGEGLRDVPGMRFLSPAPGERHNYQYVVLEIEEQAFGLSRDELVRVLEAENIQVRRYFVPGMHRCVPYKTQFPHYVDALPVTDALCHRVMQTPSGQCVTDEDIAAICGLIRFIQIHASGMKKRLAA
ncbi:MAG: aminotransferase class I/II-fold pyridoxal phosphate-dependent enzyme [Deltaproteobacteria bacterium]|jgi:dTDP-4-amino-4,6-dideoxygalactose transaminase|nr:aminotransferase class I/II-fold pyridoxal phosphate-dependent enzyme [Deltaproteobacteria bacterium]